MEKEKIFSEIKEQLDELNLGISNIDMERPWGGFFVIDESDSEKFIMHFFPAIKSEELLKGKLSPKILLIAPGKKLSWQYHCRRAEIWKLIKGSAAIVTSYTDVENETGFMQKGEVVTLKNGERHRLVGLHEWGIVAEIWVHSDAENPSDENDIIRLQDDFGR